MTYKACTSHHPSHSLIWTSPIYNTNSITAVFSPCPSNYLYLLCYILQLLYSGSTLIKRIASLSLYINGQKLHITSSFFCIISHLLAWNMVDIDPWPLPPLFHLYIHVHTLCHSMCPVQYCRDAQLALILSLAVVLFMFLKTCKVDRFSCTHRGRQFFLNAQCIFMTSAAAIIAL